MSDRSIAVIVAHPDDEVLGFGGAIAHHAKRGHQVRILILATGLASRSTAGTLESSEINTLRAQARSAAEILGAQSVEFADFPDNQMDSVPLLDVVKRIERFCEENEPETVYTHSAGDLNIDHQIVANATLTACRPVPESGITELLAGEVNSSSEWSRPDQTFEAQEFLDISDTLALKIKALECYVSELRVWPHPRSRRAVEIQAQWRGAQIGRDAAEAYNLIRRIRT